MCEVPEFLASCRARITAKQADMPTFGGQRDVPVCAGLSTALLASQPRARTAVPYGQFAYGAGPIWSERALSSSRWVCRSALVSE